VLSSDTVIRIQLHVTILIKPACVKLQFSTACSGLAWVRTARRRGSAVLLYIARWDSVVVVCVQVRETLCMPVAIHLRWSCARRAV
jgi:hypothetical protein